MLFCVCNCIVVSLATFDDDCSVPLNPFIFIYRFHWIHESSMCGMDSGVFGDECGDRIKIEDI